jgi:hypothetical protein
VGAGALAASTVAHRCAVGDLDTTAATPVVWAGLLAMMTLVGGRYRWRPRGFRGTLVAMVLAQAAVHVAMSAVPWAFGLAPHHEPQMTVGVAALVAHAAAAAALAALIAGLEGVLDRAMRVARAVRRWLGRRPRAPRVGRVLVPARTAPRDRWRTVPACRGPPPVLVP